MPPITRSGRRGRRGGANNNPPMEQGRVEPVAEEAVVVQPVQQSVQAVVVPPPAVPVYAPPNVDQVLLSVSSYVISKVLCIAYARSINLGRKDNIDLNKIVPSDRNAKHMVVHNFQVDCMLKRLHQSLFGQRYDKGNWDILLNGLVRARWAELGMGWKPPILDAGRRSF